MAGSDADVARGWHFVGERSTMRNYVVIGAPINLGPG
jgi:hypothetical protein